MGVVVGAVVLVGAVLVGRSVLNDLWGWLGWWQWPAALLLAAVLGAVASSVPWGGPPARVVDPVAERRRREDVAATDSEVARLRKLTQGQFELEVSRSLRRDGWADAHLQHVGSEVPLVVARHAGGMLLVRCWSSHQQPGARDVLALVAARRLTPGATPVFMTAGGYPNITLEACRGNAVVPMDGEDVARWFALGQAGWPGPAQRVG